MQAILFLLSFVSEFLTNETGFVRQRTGLPVAWAAGVLVAAAVVLGTPGPAAAACVDPGNCEGLACGSCHVVDCQYNLATCPFSTPYRWQERCNYPTGGCITVYTCHTACPPP